LRAVRQRWDLKTIGPLLPLNSVSQCCDGSPHCGDSIRAQRFKRLEFTLLGTMQPLAPWVWAAAFTRLAGIDPRVCRRLLKRPADTDLRDRLKDLSSERRRFGYCHLHILLKREGWHVNHCPAGYCVAMHERVEEAVSDLLRRGVNPS